MGAKRTHPKFSGIPNSSENFQQAISELKLKPHVPDANNPPRSSSQEAGNL